jgi:hypothetical protein
MDPTQCHVLWIPRFCFSGVKRTGTEDHHSSPPGAEFKNEGSLTPTSLYAFVVWIGIICLLTLFPLIYFTSLNYRSSTKGPAPYLHVFNHVVHDRFTGHRVCVAFFTM